MEYVGNWCWWRSSLGSLVEYIVWLWFWGLVGCVVCRCGHKFFETLLHVLCDAGDISLMISIDRQSGWVFHGLKSWFEVMNFLRRIFIRYSGDLYSFQRGMQLLMWIEGWSYCWWVW